MIRKQIQIPALIIFIVAIYFLVFEVQTVKSTVEIIVPSDEYRTIQEAINKAPEGARICIEEGVYNENVIVNRSVTIFGRKKETTVIDAQGFGSVLRVTTSNVTIINLTIQNSGKEGEDSGILLFRAENITISNCLIRNNNIGVLFSTKSNKTLLANNIFEGNGWGVSLKSGSDFNVFAGNTFKENQIGVVVSSSYNIFYRNNFLNNTNLQVQFLGGVSNKWDNGVEGNFWSDYEGEDTNGDGIGDTNIPIWGDSKPLIEPWSQVRTYMVNSYYVVVECNFTVASFQFNSSLSGLSFRITGPSAWNGFFNITIPKTVLDSAPNEWRIFLVSSQYFLNVTHHTQITSNNTHIMMHYSGNVAGYTVYIIASKSLPPQEKTITCIELLTNKREVKAGEPLVLYTKLTDISGQPLAGKVIVFSLLGESWNKTEVTNSSGFAATHGLFLLVGILKFRASFQGDQDFYGSFDETSVTFKPLNTTLSTPSSINATQYEPLTLVASLEDENNAPVKRATIKFYIETNGFREAIGSNKTGENGVATLIYEPAKTGVFQLIAAFDGEGIYAASSATSTLVVSPKPWRFNYVYIVFPAILLIILIVYLKLRKRK